MRDDAYLRTLFIRKRRRVWVWWFIGVTLVYLATILLTASVGYTVDGDFSLLTEMLADMPEYWWVFVILYPVSFPAALFFDRCIAASKRQCFAMWENMADEDRAELRGALYLLFLSPKRTRETQRRLNGGYGAAAERLMLAQSLSPTLLQRGKKGRTARFALLAAGLFLTVCVVGLVAFFYADMRGLPLYYRQLKEADALMAEENYRRAYMTYRAARVFFEEEDKRNTAARAREGETEALLCALSDGGDLAQELTQFLRERPEEVTVYEAAAEAFVRDGAYENALNVLAMGISYFGDTAAVAESLHIRDGSRSAAIKELRRLGEAKEKQERLQRLYEEIAEKNT